MAQAVCTINLGLKLQKIYVKNAESEAKLFYISLDDLPNFLASHNDIDSFIVKGNKSFVGKIEQKTREKELNQYTKPKTKFYYV